MHEQTTIHVAIAFDEHYVISAHALLCSIISNHHGEVVHIHAIATGISDEIKERIRSYVEGAPAKIFFYEIDPSLVSSFILTNKRTSSVYYRLFFPLLVPDSIDRLLYLDTDTIVINNLRRLVATDLEGLPLGAVYDNYVKTQPLLDIHKEGEYFNSGVMLIDTARWREGKVSEKAIDYLTRFPERILYVDQCALNAVLHARWKKLDAEFNRMYSYVPNPLSRKELSRLLENSTIIHYTLQRPWHFLCQNRLRILYHYYLKLSGIKVPFRKRYSDFELKKLPAWLMLRIREVYFDMPFFQRMWKSLKS